MFTIRNARYVYFDLPTYQLIYQLGFVCHLRVSPAGTQGLREASPKEILEGRIANCLVIEL